MAERDTVIPSQRAPFVGEDGRITTVWYRFLVDLYERTGGGTDKVEEADVAADAAQTRADDAYTLAESGVTGGSVTAAQVQEIQFLRDFGGEIP